MGSIGFGELVLIAIAAFLLLGPQNFLKFFKKMAQFLKTFKDIRSQLEEAATNFKETIEKAADDSKIENFLDESSNPYKKLDLSPDDKKIEEIKDVTDNKIVR